MVRAINRLQPLGKEAVVECLRLFLRWQQAASHGVGDRTFRLSAFAL